MSPELHAGLLGGAAVAAVVFAGIILARNPRSRPAQMHAVYGGLVAGWFVCMAMVASADTDGQVELWSRLLHLAIGPLPAVMVHLNAETAGLSHRYRNKIRTYYSVAVAVSAFGVAWPWLFDAPRDYSWGPLPAYTGWGLIPIAFIVVALADVVNIYRRARVDADPTTAYFDKVTAFYHGNMVAGLALVDFLPVYGLGVYPFGWVVLTIMHGATVFGSIRYRLIEITPEFASEQIFETLPDAVFVIDTQGLIRLTNDAGAQLLGRPKRDAVDAPLADISPELAVVFDHPIDGSAAPRDATFTASNGDLRHVRVTGSLLRDQKREPVGHAWVLHDVTEQRLAEAEKHELEEWVRHSQKLETLGVMARGIAHDFNNLLMIIQGSADTVVDRLDSGSPDSKELTRIVTAADRASELTSQLLTYAGEASVPETVVDLNELCRETAELVDAAISKKAKLVYRFGDEAPTAIADKGQMSQVLLNLITNASDALGDDVGTITVRTGTVGPTRWATEPERVLLEVGDTGRGMDPDTKKQMFNPFFTTKFTGRGLGLATVAGIVRAHDGLIRVDTEPGRGTRFTIELPAATVPRSDKAGPNKTASIEPPAAGGVVLVADDEPGVRSVTSEMLASAGFEVLESADGTEAVTLFRERSDDIDAVVLDLTMPKLGGHEAFITIREHSPDMPIVLMSGYIDDAPYTAAYTHRSSFLKKPFRQPALVAKLNEAMLADQVPTPEGG